MAPQDITGIDKDRHYSAENVGKRQETENIQTKGERANAEIRKHSEEKMRGEEGKPLGVPGQRENESTDLWNSIDQFLRAPVLPRSRWASRPAE